MNHDQATRSGKLIKSVVGVLAVGVALAYALPAVSVRGDRWEPGYSVSLSEVSFLLNIFGGAWIVDLARLGIVVAIMAAVGFTRAQAGPQAYCISLGSLAGLALPIAILKETGADSGDSLGIGMIAFSIACVVAAVLPWVLDRQSSSAVPTGSSTVPTSHSPAFDQEDMDRAIALWRGHGQRGG